MERKSEFSVSRFAVLQDLSENEEEEEQKVITKKKKKPRNKNKKKSSENTQELRNLAFSKPVSAAVIQSVHRKNHPAVQTGTPASPQQHLLVKNTASENVDHNNDPKSWEDWKDKDEAYVVNKFQSDLEAALRLSSSEKPTSTGTTKKKQKNATISFDEYCQLPSHGLNTTHKPNESFLPPGYAPEELDPNHYQVSMEMSEEKQIEESATKKSKQKKKKKKKSDNQTSLTDLLSQNTTAVSSNVNVQPSADIDPSSAVWRLQVQEKNQEIKTLEDANTKLNEELIEVKKRNKQLCYILVQGEMKEKSTLVQQVEELNNIKTELSTELQSVCSLLEQERSKVSHLRQELLHFQSSRSHNKSISEEKQP